MKKYIITPRYLDKCISTIEDNCYGGFSRAFTGSALSEFCGKPKNIQALRILEATHEIRTSTPNGSDCPAAVWLEDKGILHSYTKREKRKSAIKGFIAGIVSTVISSVLFPYLFTLLISRLAP